MNIESTSILQMNRKQKIKYINLVYIVLTLISIIFWVLGNDTFKILNDQVTRDTLSSLSTELLGVVLVFFIVNYLFTLDEWDLGDKVDRLVNKLENQQQVLASHFFHKAPDMETLIKEADSIDLCGVALGSTIDTNLSFIRDRVRSGASVRILIIENTDENLFISAQRSEGIDTEYYKKKILSTFHNLNYLKESTTGSPDSNNTGKLQIRLLPYPPSFGLKLFEEEDKGVCVVEIYPHHVGWGSPPNFTLGKETDSDWYVYFRQQYEAMWSRGKDFSSEEIIPTTQD